MAAESERGNSEGEAEEHKLLRGPHGWLNWYAERRGYPRRESTHPESIVIHPVWEEFALYTDALLDGSWFALGPYEFIFSDHVQSASVGNARRLLILRSWDHLEDLPPDGEWKNETDVIDYFGGDIGDEMAALLGLALGCRVRSGGSVRKGLPIDNMPLGLPDESNHHIPSLQPPHRRALIETLADRRTLDDARGLLDLYPAIAGPDAVALVRGAQQYVDGLWLADADPRLAWIKLVGALEVAANRRDDSRHADPVGQLKKHKPKLYRELEAGPASALNAVAEDISRLFRVEVKLRSFVKEFDPGPPGRRPASDAYRFDWSKLDDALKVIYNHRSRDLHDGIPFPWALCEPPEDLAEEQIPCERFPALGISGLGGKWTAEALPMYLHVFAHVVGGSLRNWWSSLSQDR